MADWHEKGNKCDMMDGVSYHTYYGFAIVGWEERVDGMPAWPANFVSTSQYVISKRQI